ncbi:MAG: SUMF1/EgtB/PvdO family nonheme iron enzyme [Desulfatibacillaceae bacterium]
MKAYLTLLRSLVPTVPRCIAAAVLLLILVQPAAAISDRFKVRVHGPATSATGRGEEIILYESGHAFVVGCDAYARGWGKPPDAVADAESVSELLREQGFSVNFLSNPDAATFLSALERFAVDQGSRTDARVLVWFSGLGHTVGDRSWLALANAHYPGEQTGRALFRKNAVPLEEVAGVLSKMAARHVLVMLDCCVAPTGFQTLEPAPDSVVTRDVTAPARQIIAACREYRGQPEEGGLAGLLEAALSRDGGADINGDGYVLGQELALYVKNRMTAGNEAARAPWYATLDEPPAGDFVFATGQGDRTAGPGPTERDVTPGVVGNVEGRRVSLEDDTIGTIPVGARRVSPEREDEGETGSGVAEDSQSADPGAASPGEVAESQEPAGDYRGRLFVQTDPENATVEVKGAHGPYREGMELVPGTYEVTVEDRGYEEARREVVVLPGETARIFVDLQRPGGQPGRFVNETGMEFVYIRPGTFVMGSAPDEDGRDPDEAPHEVELTEGFYMQTTEVTQSQWREIMGTEPWFHVDCGMDCPVEQVSWTEAQAFIRKLNGREGTTRYRLPTEAEWEYACRAGSRSAFYYGDESSCDMMLFDNESRGLEGDRCVDENRARGLPVDSTAPVASFPANSWGLYDMHGNVYEWCSDWYGQYSEYPAEDPEGPLSGTARVNRGGAWDSYWKDCRSANRADDPPGAKENDLGFRVAADPE